MKILKRGQTKNYDMFTMAKGNREYSQIHVKRLAKSIKEKNMLAVNPLICVKDKGKMVVYDGQHRLAAAKKLGIQIPYILVDDMTPADIARINRDQKGWSTRDYIHHYADLGHAHYTRLLAFMSEHKLAPTTAVQLMSGADYIHNGGSHILERVRDGGFKISGEEKAREIVSVLNAIAGGGCTFTRDRSFVKAIVAVYNTDVFDVSRLLPRLKYMPLEKAANWEQYVEQIDARYNYRTRPHLKVPLFFEATKSAA